MLKIGGTFKRSRTALSAYGTRPFKISVVKVFGQGYNVENILFIYNSCDSSPPSYLLLCYLLIFESQRRFWKTCIEKFILSISCGPRQLRYSVALDDCII